MKEDPCTLYLDLLKAVLTRTDFPTSYGLIGRGRGWHRYVLGPVRRLLARYNVDLVLKPDASRRLEGEDWPSDAETMIGLTRLNNLEELIVDVIEAGIPGDVIEVGVWRGGAAILMRAVLKCYDAQSRHVWVADSFGGLPAPDFVNYPNETTVPFDKITHLSVSETEVRGNFRRYGLLDETVRFLPGWFRDTLPTAPFAELALMRLDGDMYESTAVALDALYPKLAEGGYVIIDDFAIPPCRLAVEDYRRAHGVTEPMIRIDWTGVYWRKGSASQNTAKA